jgi:3-hydroxyacyl-[acyl-carrier-protein] dehydratase
MLQGDFFIISKIETTEAEIKAELIINARHKIFEGHFPGQPVVPGVCMMQMVKEIIEKVTEKK